MAPPSPYTRPWDSSFPTAYDAHMRFTIRAGTGPNASADSVMLRALGLPHGGTIKVGDTYARVTVGETAGPTDLPATK